MRDNKYCPRCESEDIMGKLGFNVQRTEHTTHTGSSFLGELERIAADFALNPNVQNTASDMAIWPTKENWDLSFEQQYDFGKCITSGLSSDVCACVVCSMVN